MFRNFFRSPYVKAGTAFFLSGTCLIVINSWLAKVHISAGIAKFNATMMPIYIGIVIAFLLCPIYNAVVRKLYTLMSGAGGLNGWDSSVKLFHGYIVPPRKQKENPYVRALKRSKMIATVVCLLLVSGIVALIGYFVIPQIIASVANLVNTMPARMEAFAAWSEVHLTRIPEAVDLINSITNAGTSEVIAWIQEHILNNDFTSIAETISNSILSFVKVFSNVFIGLLIAVYLLNYKEQLFAITRKIISATCTEKRARSLYEFGGVINETFIGFIVGRIIDGVIVGVLTYIIMTVLELPLSILISVVVGITNIIPFFGPFIGAIPSAILLLMERPIYAVYFLIAILLIQQLDGNVIGPKIVGNRIGISSFWVLVAVLVGGGLFGFIGMALGVPIFAVFYRYADKLTSQKLRKKERETETRDYMNFDKYNADKKDLFNE